MSDINADLQQSVANRRFFLSGAPQRAFNWEVNIERFNSRTTVPLQCKSISLPEREVGSAERYFINKKYDVPTRETSSKSVDVEFWDTEGMRLYHEFSKWFEVVKTKTTSEGVEVVPTDFSKTVMVTLFDTSNNALYQMNFGLAHPIRLGEVTLDYESNEAASFVVTFSYENLTELAQDPNGILSFIKDPIGSVTDRIQNITGGVVGVGTRAVSQVGSFLGF